jgi:hypothetical protein
MEGLDWFTGLGLLGVTVTVFVMVRRALGEKPGELDAPPEPGPFGVERPRRRS